MLVLTRKVGEKIVIGDDIVITVVRLNHDKVRLGIDAPAHVPVHRLEVVERDRISRSSVARDAGSLPTAST